uniref:Uncharacterized protein n=1 Tax=Manihot esculenta TaxID=3983 RepID=A0A2C9WDH2_MANES
MITEKSFTEKAAMENIGFYPCPWFSFKKSEVKYLKLLNSIIHDYI